MTGPMKRWLCILFVTISAAASHVQQQCDDPITIVTDIGPEQYRRAHEYISYNGPINHMLMPNRHEYTIACASSGEPHSKAVARAISRSHTGAIQHKRLRYARTVYDTAEQWHLSRANLTAAWGAGAMGNNTIVAIVDDGLAWHHVDLVRLFDISKSANFNSKGGGSFDNRDPMPSAGDAHGTGAAGVAAGSGFRGPPPKSPLCGHGVAPMARLAGIRLIADAVSDATEARALSHEVEAVTVYSCSWGPLDDATRVDGPGPLTRAVMHAAASSGRGGLGSIYVWAAGNGAQYGDSCAYDGYASHPAAMAVAAVTSTGTVAYYSEPCPAVFVSAPSSGAAASSGITTTTIPTSTGDRGCRDDFGGTSAAAPYVAGVVALILGANPALTSHDVFEIIADTATMVDPQHKSWVRNAAGRYHSHYYGFGLVNAAAAVERARSWPTDSTQNRRLVSDLPAVQTDCSQHRPCRVANTPLTINFSVTCNTTGDTGVLVASLTTTISHRRRGELSFALISPSGTSSTIQARQRDATADYVNWVTTFRPFYGEPPCGVWSLVVTDVLPNNRFAGILNDAQLSLQVQTTAQ